MKRLAAFLLFCATGLLADTLEIVPFRAVLLPTNEVPAVNTTARGAVTILAHIVRIDAGQIVSGSVDFGANFTVPEDTTITGMHIHNGPAGVNAGVTINTGLSGTNTFAATAGPNTLQRQAQVRPGDQ